MFIPLVLEVLVARAWEGLAPDVGLGRVEAQSYIGLAAADAVEVCLLDGLGLQESFEAWGNCPLLDQLLPVGFAAGCCWCSGGGDRWGGGRGGR